MCHRGVDKSNPVDDRVSAYQDPSGLGHSRNHNGYRVLVHMIQHGVDLYAHTAPQGGVDPLGEIFYTHTLQSQGCGSYLIIASLAGRGRLLLLMRIASS